MESPITINNWPSGIADHPLHGNGLIKNAVIYEAPGAVMPNLDLTARNVSSSSTFTANAGNDTITVTDIAGFGEGNTDYMAVIFSNSGGALPAGLVAGTVYFVKTVSQVGGTLQVSTTVANVDSATVVDITDAGTGTHTITTVTMGVVRHMDKDQGGNVYAIDSNGRVWVFINPYFVLMPGNTLTGASGLGLKTFTNSDASHTYLLAFRGHRIDILRVTSAADRKAPSWTNDWISLQSASGSSNSHHCIVGQDNKIYYCDGRFVGSIQEVPGSVFLPSNGATYTAVAGALVLPQGELASWLEELGINLLVAGQNTSKIYPWNRSAASFALPVICSEGQIFRIKNLNNTIYILAGTKGNIYTTNGSFAQLFTRVPPHLMTTEIKTWGGIEVYNNALYFGIGSVSVNSNHGMYRLTEAGELTLDNQPTAGATSATAILNTNTNLFIGHSTGVDTLSTGRYNNYEAVVQTEFLRVGTKTKPGKISEVEIQLNNSLGSGSVRISYRVNLSASFTVLTTFTLNNPTSYKADAGLTNLENIQFQLELAGAGSDTSALQLFELRLIP